MNNLDRNPEKQLALEDLLKIKKYERPGDAFWEKFDNQLHEKTLKELVYKPSFVSRIAHFFAVSFKPALSAGALALLTLLVQPVFYSRSAAVIAESTSAHQIDHLVDFASVKRNYVKNNIVTESGDDCNYANVHISPVSNSNGVRYLVGNLASVNLGNSVISNTVY